jgi:hypothetical protein
MGFMARTSADKTLESALAEPLPGKPCGRSAPNPLPGTNLSKSTITIKILYIRNKYM